MVLGHDHPTGERGYVIGGRGTFGGMTLQVGDAFWGALGEFYAAVAEFDLVSSTTSLPRTSTEPHP
jgi:hypothetical protein